MGLLKCFQRWYFSFSQKLLKLVLLIISKVKSSHTDKSADHPQFRFVKKQIYFDKENLK